MQCTLLSTIEILRASCDIDGHRG